jgi:hypothetical protein
VRRIHSAVQIDLEPQELFLAIETQEENLKSEKMVHGVFILGSLEIWN